MAIADAYATSAQYKAIISMTSGDHDSEIDAQCLAVSRYLDRSLGRFFTRDDSVVQRIYYPSGYYAGNPEAENPWLGVRGARDLETDDIASTTGLVIKIDTNRDGVFTDEAALATTDYELWPLNADKGPEPQPWNRIHLPAWSGKLAWPAGCPVQITAIFGWPAVPQAIVQATCQLVGIYRLESPRATSSMSAGFDTVLGTSKQAQDIVDRLQTVYSRRRVFA